MTQQPVQTQQPVAQAPWRPEIDLAVRQLKVLGSIKTLLWWVVALLAAIAVGIMIITAVAVTVPVYPA